MKSNPIVEIDFADLADLGDQISRFAYASSHNLTFTNLSCLCAALNELMSNHANTPDELEKVCDLLFNEQFGS